MDGDMQVDPDSEKDTTSNNFVFSSPSVISSLEKPVNFGTFSSDNVFGAKSSNQSEVSNFIFAKPTSIDRADYKDDTKTSPFLAQSVFSQPEEKSNSPFISQDVKKADGFSKNTFLTKDEQKFSSFSTQETKKSGIFSQTEISNASPFVTQETKRYDIFSSTEKNSPFTSQDVFSPLEKKVSPFVTQETTKLNVFSSPENILPCVKQESKKSDIFSSTESNVSPFASRETKKSDVFSQSEKISPFSTQEVSSPPGKNISPFASEDMKTSDVFPSVGKNSNQETKKSDIFSRLSEAPNEDRSRSVTKSPHRKKVVTSPYSAKDIKKMDAYSQLEKNSKKNQDVKLELSRSISCLDVPDSLLVKAVAKEYFEQFGEILKITIRPRRKMITVYYATDEAAKIGYKNSGSFLTHDFKVEWTTPELLNAKPIKKKETIKGKIASILNIDDEVREELAALRGLEYNLPDPQNLKNLNAIAKAKVKKAKEVANKETPKRTLPLVSKSVLKTGKTSTQKPIAVKTILKSSKSVAQKEELTVKVEAPVGNQNIMKITKSQIEEMQNLVRSAGTTAEERYRILDARDRLMRLKRENQKQKHLATAKVTRGSCPDMCPEKERYMREFQRQVVFYEQLRDTDEYKIDHHTAVKQYSRSSADQEEPMPHDLRPVKSLKMTMSYLLHEISDLCEEENTNLEEWFNFLWDRMRSIRKDITQQELCCVDSVELVEQCARFHILCSERLCAEETSVFDPKINSENLTKCLQTLKYMYDDLRQSEVTCKNEPEFRAYIILLNLNNGTCISELRTLSAKVQKSPEIKFALEIHSTLAMNNYSRFFKLVRKTTYLNGCILLRYFSQVRVKAVATMVKAYCRASGTAEYPLYEFVDILGFEDENEVCDFCSHVGLKCDTDEMMIKLKRESFREPENNIEQGRAFNLILSKRQTINQGVGECIAGGVLTEKLYEDYKPHNSFDEEGYLFKQSYNAQDQNANDPYDFVDDDVDFVSDVEDKKIDTKVSNKVEEKKPISFRTTATDKTTFGTKMSSAFVFKKPENIFTTASTDKVQSTIVNQQTPTSKTTEATTIFGQGSSTTSSVFINPHQLSVFSNVTTKPSPMPLDSPFSMAVNKSIFSGSSGIQTNLFKVPTKPSSPAKQEFNRFEIPSSTSNDRVSIKRRLEDDAKDSLVAQKKSLTEREEQLKKQLEMARHLEAELKRKKRLQKIDDNCILEYDLLEEEIIDEICSSIVRSELDRINLINALTEKMFENLFRKECESILDEQLFIQDMLIEVDRRLRDRLIMKYYKIWKQWAAKRRAHRREALDNTPVWLQPESIEEKAKKFYHPEQKVAIKYARECKRRSLIESEKKVVKHTPIEFIICVGLKENAKSLDVKMSQCSFWKMVISWPLLEDRITIWRHKKTVNKYLCPDDCTLEPIFIQHKPSPFEHLNICIRYFEGMVCENRLTGMDSLLFIVSADENTRSIERRLTKTVLSREKLMPIPLVILVFGDDKNDPNCIEVSSAVESLMESGYISEYTILYEKNTDENVVLRVFQSATLWLAVNRSPAVPLEMDHMKQVLDDCLTEELWLRIQGHLSHDQKYIKPLRDPNFIIDLHNEAVNHLTDIILDPESMTYTDFAPELKIYLNNKLSYPCTYEYFDTIWKHPEYRAELERIMNSFVLPSWRYKWPIHDMMELHEAILKYCKQILSYDTSLSISNNIMSDLFLIAGYSEDSCPNFSDVLLHIMGKKISDLGGNTRVVYNKNHIKHFRTLPWWFKSNVLMDYMARYEEERKEEQEEEMEIEENLTPSKIDESPKASISQPPVTYECDVDKLEETINQLEEEVPLEDFIEESREQLDNIKSIAHNFEKQLEEQRLKSQDFEARLKAALEDDTLDIDS